MTRIIKIVLFLNLILICSCNSQYLEPDLYFEGKFDPKNVNTLEKFIKQLAKDKGFQIFEKDRNQMSFLSQGKEAFYISYYIHEDIGPVMWISNVGAPNILVLGFNSFSDFSRENAKELAIVIINYLKNELDTCMMPVDPNGENRQKIKRKGCVTTQSQ